jgi:hypothetical protein
MKHYHYMHHEWPVVTLQCENHSKSFADNTHRVVLACESATEFIGWPDPTDKRNSEHWQPGIDKPLLYPKFAWEVQS